MAAARNKKQRYVLLCHLLLVALLVIGDAAVVGAGATSPPIQVLHQTEQLQQGLRRRPDEAPAPGDGGLPASSLMNNKEQTTTGAGGGGGRRMLVGSRAPTTCTYNECRGCRHRCSVQVVPIDASDPINSAYHYKCVCHL
ncbi:hypothetical protein SEVIR_6G225100v4 [Setaria viridis]|uniref:Stomagen C-terminal domain-containing protein n=3 Tax=Setaria TaxID=4554 RepID=A0A368RQT7_SETIT|nr:uncharacterized protein LOC111257623 [Setaria italica]XP_034600200.1 uncharacterized protein LOC117860888 [Setaria viridis]RCV31930.1 hypothetical protein SETIT_6G217800v2 [Setaria italica]TKW11308.1 hypothetical protein SEVIR_6G225100v2 [Setaria viridis]